MSLERNLEDPLVGTAGFIFQTPVQAKRIRARPDRPPSAALPAAALKKDALRRVAHVAMRRAEVMVKVSGAAKGKQHLKEHLTYITRNGALTAERSDGELIVGRDAVKELAEEWWAMRGVKRPITARDTINLVLSMPRDTDRKAVARAASLFAHVEFGGDFDYVLVHHEDTDHPHAHLTVRTVNAQGRCLNPRKSDLQAWREGFAAALRGQGVHAEATPRRARGVVHKGTRQALRHMGKRSQVNQWKVGQALKSLHAASAPSPEPWRAAIEQRQEKVRFAWRTLAQALDGQGEAALALQVRAFVDAMPLLQTRQDALCRQAAAARDAQASDALLRRAECVLQRGRLADQDRTR